MVSRTTIWPDTPSYQLRWCPGVSCPPGDTCPHLHDLPRKVQNAAGCSLQEAPQPCGGPVSHGPGLQHAFSLQAPLLLASQALSGLQLPLLLVEPEPDQPLFLGQMVEQVKRRWRHSKTGTPFHGNETAQLPSTLGISPTFSGSRPISGSLHCSVDPVGDSTPPYGPDWRLPPLPTSQSRHPEASYLGGSKGWRLPQDLLPGGHRQPQVLGILLAVPEDPLPLCSNGDGCVGWLHKAKVFHVGSAQALRAVWSLGHAHLQPPKVDLKHGLSLHKFQF